MYPTVILYQILCWYWAYKVEWNVSLTSRRSLSRFQSMWSPQCIEIWGRTGSFSLEHKDNMRNNIGMVIEQEKGWNRGLREKETMKRCQWIKTAWCVLSKQMLLVIQRGDRWKNSTAVIDGAQNMAALQSQAQQCRWVTWLIRINPIWWLKIC